MLESLDKIDWKNLHHAYGSAEDVPQLLRALASNSKADREEAMHELYGNIWHQGTVYEATAYAVPILIELLEMPEVKAKDTIIYLLQAIGTGSSYHDVHAGPNFYHTERHTHEFQIKLKQELQWVKDAHLATAKGLSTYFQLLTSTNTKLRQTIPYLLAVFVDQAKVIDIALQQQFAKEKNAVVKASILLALASLERSQPQQNQIVNQNYFKEIIDASKIPSLVQFTAALSLIQIDPHLHYEVAIPILLRTIANIHTQYKQLPWTMDAEAPVNAVHNALKSMPAQDMQWHIELLQRNIPILKKAALGSMQDLLIEWRPAIAYALPILIAMVDDDDLEIQQYLVMTLTMCGKEGRAVLEALQNSNRIGDSYLNNLASKALQRLERQNLLHNIDAYGSMKYRKLLNDAPTELINIIETRLYPPYKNDSLLEDAIFTLVSQANISAGFTLRKALQHEYPQARIIAAWALWKLESNIEDSLPVLIEELERGVGWPLILQCFEEMAEKASNAIPILQRIINSEFRWPIRITHELLVDFDDLLQLSAKNTLSKITNAA